MQTFMNSNKSTRNQEKFSQIFEGLSRNWLIFERWENSWKEIWNSIEKLILIEFFILDSLNRFFYDTFSVSGVFPFPLEAPLHCSFNLPYMLWKLHYTENFPLISQKNWGGDCQKVGRCYYGGVGKSLSPHNQNSGYTALCYFMV